MTVKPTTTSSGSGCGSGCPLFLPSTYPSLTQNRTYIYKPINNIHVFGSITFSQTPKSKLGSRCRRRLLAVSQFVEDSSQSEEPNTTDANIDIKLPRRSLLVQFTCDVCGERTERLINRLAYERGLIYVQCAGCLRHHKLVDNLGLMVEYDLRKEIKPDSNTDQV
ncbi:hypothetical protein SO802_012483 [Lithocarpus litseifolius]|uniref:DNL-type domain-containing protein n=1 Tax=Lithocarpus litseifolius TaxID=425828 RepID=A0AAW2D515_9ROSI